MLGPQTTQWRLDSRVVCGSASCREPTGASHITTLQQPDWPQRRWLHRLRKGAILRAVPDRIEIRQPAMIDEFRACHAVQEQAWAFPGLLVVPYSQLMTIHRNGGVLLCAFEGQQSSALYMAFLAGVPRTRSTFSPSAWVCFRPTREKGSVRSSNGHADRDLTAVWTYDPLEAPNAQLNIAKLDGIARHYERNVMGPRVKTCPPTACCWSGSY